jgi:hypothetical protein
MPRNRDNDVVELIVDSEDVDEVIATDLDEELDEEAYDDAAEEYDELTDIASDELGDDEDAIGAALSPGVPLLLMQRSHQHSKYLPAVVADARRRHGGRISVGVTAPLPRMSPAGVREFFTRTDAAVRIADPEAFARADSFGRMLAAQRDGKPYVGTSTEKYWSYITDSLTAGGTPAWVEKVLDAQRDVGATVLLTPGVWADPGDVNRSLDTIRQHTTWARAASNDDEHLIVNITGPANWMSNDRLRDRLLDELVDMDDTVFYLRIRWPLLAQPYGQLLDSAILDGYAEACNVLDENDKALILANAGLTGWVALAWGAHGLSTGVGAGERAFADNRVIKIKQNPRPAPTRRTFAAPILHVTDAPTAQRIDGLPGLAPCRCRFCRAQRQVPQGQFDKGLAGAHYLRHVIDLTAGVSRHSRGRRVAARRIVRDARGVVAAVAAAVPLTGNNEPKHLQLWADRLR